eukprot:scaffold155_cov347-Pavlova_lutheri.AAC.67
MEQQDRIEPPSLAKGHACIDCAFANVRQLSSSFLRLVDDVFLRLQPTQHGRCGFGDDGVLEELGELVGDGTVPCTYVQQASL